MPFSKLSIVAACVFCLVLGGAARSENVVQVPGNDPEMSAAFGKARAGLDGFLVKLAAPPAGTKGYSVKVGIKDGPAPEGFSIGHPGDQNVEYFWMTEVEPAGDGYKGVIDNEPDSIRNVSDGQTISFKKEDISDWMYFEGDKIKGNFTACPALRHASREEQETMRERFGFDCK